MSQVIRVSLPTYNALTDTDPDHYALYSDSDWVLIKELSRGTGTIAYESTAQITHSLGYVPFYLVYCERNSTQYIIANDYAPNDIEWLVSADTNKLYIKNNFSSTYTNYRYYIFYDLIE